MEVTSDDRDNPGFSLYVHLPYCLHKCPYCDFNTYAVRRIPEQRYAEALLRELDDAAEDAAWRGRTVETVFLGGGTPSLFSAGAIGRLLGRIDERFGLVTDAEITMEVNPGSLEGGAAAKLRDFRAAGVNRLSVGGQTFNPTHLHTLGRIHGPDDTVNTLEAARAADFHSLSCDLIFAIPDQTEQEWSQDIDRLLDLGPDHVSTYSLTYEHGTPMTGLKNAGRIRPADEELERSMFELAIARLTDAGYRHYEISNFARPGHRARHNLAYWTVRDYLGIGAGAHGFFRCDPAADGSWGRRYANIRSPESYMSAAAGERAASTEELDRAMAVSEYVMLGLRLLEGIDERDFIERFGAPLAAVLPDFDMLFQHGLLAREGARARLTATGLMMADGVITKLAAGV